MSSADLIERKIRTKRKVRTIVTYADSDSFLRSEHEQILQFIRENSYPSLFAKAYIPHRGIFENVSAHLYNDIFIKIDIKDFFSSINHGKLQRQLYIELNKVAKEHVSREQCKRIVSVCSCGYPGLPLGLVTSPDLANLYLKGFDSFLFSKLKKIPIDNPIYTRYADDLTISFKRTDDYPKIVADIKGIVSKLLEEFYLRINDKKAQVIDLSISNHVKITGINLIRDKNNFRHISVGKKLKNELFWKAIHYYDNPDCASDLDVERLKGLLSFVLSVEKEGISYTFSRGMRQLVYDRGFNNIQALISALPNKNTQNVQRNTMSGRRVDLSQVITWNYYQSELLLFRITNVEFDCQTKNVLMDFGFTSLSSDFFRLWIKEIGIYSRKETGNDSDFEKEIFDNYISVGHFNAHGQMNFRLEIADSSFEERYLCPRHYASNLGLNACRCCDWLYIVMAIDKDTNDDCELISFFFDANHIKITNAPNQRRETPHSFSSSDILYIYKGNILCHKNRHNIIQATAILHGKTDNEIKINVEYCTDCQKYLLEYSLYENYRDIYGVLIGNLRMVVNGKFDGEYDLALESPLKLSGYNVSQKEGLTSSERRLILARIVHDGIMSKGDVIRYLSYFIRMNGAKNGMDLAVQKWNEDMRFIQSYDMSIQPHVYISAIDKYSR